MGKTSKIPILYLSFVNKDPFKIRSKTLKFYSHGFLGNIVVHILAK